MGTTTLNFQWTKASKHSKFLVEEPFGWERELWRRTMNSFIPFTRPDGCLRG